MFIALNAKGRERKKKGREKERKEDLVMTLVEEPCLDIGSQKSGVGEQPFLLKN